MRFALFQTSQNDFETLWRLRFFKSRDISLAKNFQEILGAVFLRRGFETFCNGLDFAFLPSNYDCISTRAASMPLIVPVGDFAIAKVGFGLKHFTDQFAKSMPNRLASRSLFCGVRFSFRLLSLIHQAIRSYCLLSQHCNQNVLLKVGKSFTTF